MSVLKLFCTALYLLCVGIANAQLVNTITFDDLSEGQHVESNHYLAQGVVLSSQPTGYLYGSGSHQSTGQALWVNGNGVDRKEVSITFFLPGTSSMGTIDEFYTLVRAPGSWTVEYWGPFGEFFGRYASNDLGVGTTFAQGMHPHRLLFYGEIPWSEISIDDFQFSDIAPVPEPATIGLIGSALVLAARRRRR
ncbi:MAG: PEP-CTERM sorting domain-containing protein [Candidatus Berkelbacteria bacterium]|nr:PEP-CTERM sorting domain-containing protein [Candidatus Berkelbacteria bacterium]